MVSSPQGDFLLTAIPHTWRPALASLPSEDSSQLYRTCPVSQQITFDRMVRDIIWREEIA